MQHNSLLQEISRLPSTTSAQLVVTVWLSHNTHVPCFMDQTCLFVLHEWRIPRCHMTQH